MGNHPRPPGVHLGQPPRGPRPSGLQMPQGTIGGSSTGQALAVPNVGRGSTGQALPVSDVRSQPPIGLPAPGLAQRFELPPVPNAAPRNTPALKSSTRTRMMFSACIGQLMADASTVPLGNALRKQIKGNPQVVLVFDGDGADLRWVALEAREMTVDIAALEASLSGESSEEQQAAALLRSAMGRRYRQPVPPRAAPEQLPPEQAREQLPREQRETLPPDESSSPDGSVLLPAEVEGVTLD